jgi:hypothetical protein
VTALRAGLVALGALAGAAAGFAAAAPSCLDGSWGCGPALPVFLVLDVVLGALAGEGLWRLARLLRSR